MVFGDKPKDKPIGGMKYSVNWTKGKEGNQAREGQTVSIKCSSEGPSPAQVLFGVYQNGFPVIIGQKPGGKIDFKLSRKGMSLKGEATLKVTCYDSTWRSFGWKDGFKIV